MLCHKLSLLVVSGVICRYFWVLLVVIGIYALFESTVFLDYLWALVVFISADWAFNCWIPIFICHIRGMSMCWSFDEMWSIWLNVFGISYRLSIKIKILAKVLLRHTKVCIFNLLNPSLQCSILISQLYQFRVNFIDRSHFGLYLL